MGGCGSKENKSPSNNNNKGNSVVTRDYSYSDDIRVESINRYDEQIINIIRRDLRENPQIFILNNTLMSMQFFENYQKDVFKLTSSISSKMEKELNRMLLKDETMECTCPDIIFEKVNKNVRYRPLHGPKKHSSEPLVTKRLYVINDTIEVVNSMDIPQYTSIDKPAYQVRIEESTRKGKLKKRPTEIYNGSDEEDSVPELSEEDFFDTVIPSVAIDWPAEQTFEFIMREDRPTITDRRTGYRYRWPTDEMLKDIKSMSCVLVPKGYWVKKGNYSDANIEWEIAFPKAERYIESRMSHSQTRCFLFLLTIHKAYIDPISYQHGLLTEHIRCHMYWECETNYRDWPEHRLGTKLLKVITNLNNRLSKGVLPDYFIKQKNLFESIPKKYLQFAQKVFHDVLQSPAMYFMKALRNLRYTSGKFYPPLDFKELHRILTQTQANKIVNPSLLTAPPNLKRKRYNDAEIQLRHLQELKHKEKILRMKFAEKENAEKVEERKESVDSIDLGVNINTKFPYFI
ncbi:hypothetical protein NQ314_002350 [Rhamnusium bicolor]|uniref:Mab-21-like HhH/H2TH-like domain-containing protein n=1 Tax=Rhamnusium bicolor TaxID=1586634 RepID=A0AAV8ZS41_9CUCU|nr:hypothetical protein NQ314_002350 [Rhamnusium bicolor]